MTNPKLERRAYELQELRVVGDDGKTRIAGSAAVFNQLSEDLGGFREKIAPGAFKNSLGGDVRALFNHDANFILGRTKSKTLRLNEDRNGLHFEIDPPDSDWARHVVAAIERGDVSGASFGFRARGDDWEEVDGEIVRTLLDVELFDVSPVVFPAYPQTDVALRALDDWKKGRDAKAAADAAAVFAAGPALELRRRRLDLDALD